MWRAIRRRTDVESQTRDEFRAHIERRTADLIRRGVARAIKVTRGMGSRIQQASAGAGGMRFGGMWTFDRCVHATGKIPALAADTVVGRRLGVQGTPMILINDIRLDGLPPLDSLEAYVGRARVAQASRALQMRR